MATRYPSNPFARYADDIVIHCKTQEEAENLLTVIKERLLECKLTVHPEKTKIVYCKDSNRDGDYKGREFDFLGFTFRPRLARNKQGQFFVSFSPAISKKAEKTIRDTIRSWKIHNWTGSSLERIVEELNPRLRGWLNYYAKFRRSALNNICKMFQACLVKWAKNKFRALKRRMKNVRAFIAKKAQENPKLFVHWEYGFGI